MQVQYQNVFNDIDDIRLQSLTAIILKSTPSQGFKFNEWMSPTMSEYLLKLNTTKPLFTNDKGQLVLIQQFDQRLHDLEKIFSANFLPFFNSELAESSATHSMVFNFLRLKIKEKAQMASDKMK